VREAGNGVLVLTAEVEQLTARDQHVEVRALTEQPRNVRRCAHDLLEVVEQQEELLVPDVRDEAVSAIRRPSRPRRSRAAARGWRERDPEDAVGVAIGERPAALRCEPRLPRPARPCERDETNVVSCEERVTPASSFSRPRKASQAPAEFVWCRVLRNGKEPCPS
jgi:hypothetical protein